MAAQYSRKRICKRGVASVWRHKAAQFAARIESYRVGQKNDKLRLVVFLSKPQAWYGITR
jgi:hypothetical protein